MARTQQHPSETTQAALEQMIEVDGIYLLEEGATSHLIDFAQWLESRHGRKLKRSGLNEVDYFHIAEQVTQRFIDKSKKRRDDQRTSRVGQVSLLPPGR